MKQIPSHYRAPLRSRVAITEWLKKTSSPRGGSNYDHSAWLFCFNVKAHSADLSFDGLLKAAQKHGGISDIHPGDAIWEEAARRVYEGCKDNLWEWAIEDAQRVFRSDRSGKPDDQAYSMLYDGTEVDTRFAFYGRSGGWLVLTSFEGVTLEGDIDEVLTEMSFTTLRRLYRFLVMFTADLERHSPSERVEEAAAWALFVNVCEPQNLPTSELVRKEDDERAHWEARDTVTVGVLSCLI